MFSRGFKKLPIDKIDAEPVQQETADLRESLHLLGMLHPIGVDLANRILWGRKRLAAARDLGWTTIDAHVYDVPGDTDREAITIAENIHRRDLSAMERRQALARWVAYYEAREGQHGSGDAQAVPDESARRQSRSGGRGRKSPATRAAEAAGTTPSEARRAISDVRTLTAEEQAELTQLGAGEHDIRAVAGAPNPIARQKAMADVRAKAAAKTEPKPPKKPKAKKGEVDEVGNILPADVAPSYVAARTMADEIDRHLVAAQAAFTRGKSAILLHLNGQAQAVLSHLECAKHFETPGTIHNIAAVLRSRRPYSVCVYCKCVPSLRARCAECHGTGWIGKGAHARAEDRLHVWGKDAVVYRNGKELSVAALLAEETAA